MTTLEILEKARERISDPEKWCQDTGEDGEKRCMVTAVREVSEFGCEAQAAAFRALRAALGVHFDNRLATYNDTHSHAEVLAAFDRAIAAERTKDPA